MDQFSNEAGNRKSLVCSRLELFEQINAVADHTNDVKTATRLGNRKAVSRSNSNVSNAGDISCGRGTANGVNSDVGDGGIDAVALEENTRRDESAESVESDLLADLKFLSTRDNLSPCSKRVSYNLAVSKGEFGRITIHKDKPVRRDDPIDENDNEEIAEITRRDVDTINESDTENEEVEKTADDLAPRVHPNETSEDGSQPVQDISIEDLNSTKLTEDILNVISSSRITNDYKFDETDNDSVDATKRDVDYPEELNPFGDDDEAASNVCQCDDIKSPNPFGPDSDDESSKIETKVNTNPFWSGSEEEDESSLDNSSVKKTPVPLPRSVKKPPVLSVSPQPSPKPRIRSAHMDGSTSSSNVSPSPSRRSLQGAGRKLSGDSLDVSFQRSPGSQSMNSTLRKKKPPPPPPPVAARTSNHDINATTNQSNGLTNKTTEISARKVHKTVVSPWKNKKGPAPARPIPLRRPVKEMPIEDIKTEMCDIEIRQQELERQSKQLEQMIRDQTTNSDNTEDSSSHEELVLQLFELVNEKNELFRRHSELMYMRKMHNLEEEHADIEYQLRCLMLQPESNKTDCDKTKEEELLKRLLEVVERRNEIIEAMEKDRLRETAEDKSVTTQLDTDECSKEEKSGKKLKKKKDKLKERKEEDGEKTHDSKHSPGKVIKQKFMTLRHSAKKLNTKIPH